ncbi:hypothetical protein [Cytobacillus praedii]|uniref:DUF7210 family protein n=1 Tax=Cytobacillus praedii TaxID=1742358 RepID=UPI0013F4323B|nr:hypothetical protein [Cytobacillus praedii]
MADEKPKKPAKKDVKKVTFIENVKHDNNRYKKGELAEFSMEDYKVLLKAGVILEGD